MLGAKQFERALRQEGAVNLVCGAAAGPVAGGMTTAARSPYARFRFPAEIISHAVWLYFRFPLSLRMVDELLAGRGITVSHETVRQWALEFGQVFANPICRCLARLSHAT